MTRQARASSRLSGPQVITSLAIVALLCGCGRGTPVAPLVPADGHSHHAIVEQTRPLAGVRGVALDVEVIYELRIEQGPAESLWLRADEVIMQYISTPVRGGILQLSYPLDLTQANRPPLPIQAVLTVIDLEDIELRRSGRITASRLAVDRLTIRSRGAGEILVSALSARALEVEVLGGGGVRIAGEVEAQRATLAGRGAYEAGDLASDEATVDVSQAGSATVRVSERLRATVAGSGSIYYFGDPIVDARVTGSGEVVKLGD